MKTVRAGTAIATLALVLSFALAWALGDATPFTVVGGAAVSGKWLENWQERRQPRAEEP